MVIDDEPGVCQLCQLYLEREGFQVTWVHRGDEVLEAMERWRPDLLVLDIMLPGMSGWDVCRKIRQQSQIPIIMLTARDEDGDRILGLELGADDYLVKPFNPRELVARVRAVLRRTNANGAEPESGPVYRSGPLTVDVERRIVTLDGKEVNLTPKEFELLHCLIRRPKKTYSRTELLELVWGYDYFGDERTIDVHIKRLRRKIEPPDGTHRFIHTVWGVGYRFGGPTS
mgnify:CR=1 FL=1